MILLDASQVAELLPMDEAIESDKEAFLLHSRKMTEVPVRTNFDLDGGVALFMPAWVKGGTNSVGIKIVSVFPGNAARGVPTVPAQMVLLDTKTGEVAAMMNGVELTRRRTGAISGAATDILARRDATIGALIGAGGQAMAQLEAMLYVRPLCEIRVFDANPARLENFVEKAYPLARRQGASISAAASADEAIDGADVITTVTTSADPVFDGNTVKKGAHVNGVGSFTPNMRELDLNLLLRARVFVDNREAVLSEAGDFLIPKASGLYDTSAIIGEIGDVIAGTLPGRTSNDDITVLKTVGFAVLDVAAAAIVYRNAVSRGIGTEVNL